MRKIKANINVLTGLKLRNLQFLIEDKVCNSFIHFKDKNGG